MNEDISDLEPQEGQANTAREKLAELQAFMGFEETDEMRRLGPQVIEAMARDDPVVISFLLGRYQEMGETLIENPDPSKRPRRGFNPRSKQSERGQLGLMLATTRLWYEAGRFDRYDDHIISVLVYSRLLHFEATRQVLQELFDELFEAGSTEEIITACKAEFPASCHDYLDEIANIPPQRALVAVASLIIDMDLAEVPRDFFNRMGWATGA